MFIWAQTAAANVHSLMASGASESSSARFVFLEGNPGAQNAIGIVVLLLLWFLLIWSFWEEVRTYLLRESAWSHGLSVLHHTFSYTGDQSLVLQTLRHMRSIRCRVIGDRRCLFYVKRRFSQIMRSPVNARIEVRLCSASVETIVRVPYVLFVLWIGGPALVGLLMVVLNAFSEPRLWGDVLLVVCPLLVAFTGITIISLLIEKRLAANAIGFLERQLARRETE